jgi:hypothetical protein
MLRSVRLLIACGEGMAGVTDEQGRRRGPVRRLAGLLAAAMVAATVPVIGAGTAYALGPGEACVFQSPSGADDLGHIGWGFRVGQGDQWIYGATENPTAQGTIRVGDGHPLGAWHGTGTAAQMLQAFQSHGAEYTGFKCASFTNSSAVTAAENEVHLIEDIGIPANGGGANILYNIAGGYNLQPGWNCMDHTNAILSAYGAPNLPNPTLVLIPNGYFAAFPGVYAALNGQTWQNGAR